MNTRHASRWFWPALAAICLTALFLTNHAAAIRIATQTQDAAAKASIATSGGLTVVTFVVKPGIVKVNLPDDIRAGDTISGTVSAEPNGNNKEEQTTNRTELKKLGIQLIGSQTDKPEDVGIGDVSTVFKYSLITNRESGNVFTVGLVMVGGQTLTKVNVPITSSGAIITPDPKTTVPTTASSAVITPDPKITPTFIIPPLGQTGRPLNVYGEFDGDSSNLVMSWSIMSQDNVSHAPPLDVLQGNTQSNKLDCLAESPRKAVFTAPTNVTGPLKLTLTEAGKETKGPYRNVGVQLSAPKTNLMRGEKTTLTVEVRGLEGIKEDAPLQLDSKGVINMEGGNFQNLRIKPSEVTRDGRYTTNRAITGVQAGGFTVTATVIVTRFDFRLQDDTDPNRIFHFNSFTGDYIFACGGGSCRPSGSTGGTQTGGTTGKPGGTTPPGGTDTPPITPTGTTLTGIGKPAMKGCIITLSHNAPDRRVFARLDVCTKTGDASVQTNSPKADIKITDKNTTDNTAGSPPK